MTHTLIGMSHRQQPAHVYQRLCHSQILFLLPSPTSDGPNPFNGYPAEDRCKAAAKMRRLARTGYTYRTGYTLIRMDASI